METISVKSYSTDVLTTGNPDLVQFAFQVCSGSSRESDCQNSMRRYLIDFQQSCDATFHCESFAGTRTCHDSNPARIRCRDFTMNPPYVTVPTHRRGPAINGGTTWNLRL